MISKFIRDESGATLVEYIIIGVMGLTALGGVAFTILACAALVKFIVS